jgi:branched-chain amino acid transport system substrate-binding protein
MNRQGALAGKRIVIAALLLVLTACAGNQARLREEALRAGRSVPGAGAAVPAATDDATLLSGGGAVAAATPEGGAVTGATGPAAGAARSAAGSGAKAAGPSASASASGAAGSRAAAGPAGASGGGSGPSAAAPSASAAATGGSRPGSAGGTVGGPAAGLPNGGATDIGVTADRILVGGVWFHESYLDRYSRVAEHATRAFFNEVNRAGGVFGRKIEYVSCIDGGDSSRARACFKDLVENKKVFMLGPSVSWSTGTIQDYVKQQKIPFVGSFGLYLEEYKNDNRYSFPTQVPVFDIARLFGKFLLEQVKPKSVGISYLNIEAAQECMKGLEDYLSKAGVAVVAKVSNEFDEPDLTPQVLKMRQANPDIVAFCNDPVNNAKFVGVAARSQRYKPPMGWIGGWPTVPEFGKIVGDWGIGHYGFSSVCYHEAPECDADPDVRLFKAQVNKYYPGDLDRMHYYGQNLWCGAKMITEALKLAGPNLTREGLLSALDSGAFNGWGCQGMQLFFKTGLRAGSRVGQMLQLDQSLHWRLVKPTYSAD